MDVEQLKRADVAVRADGTLDAALVGLPGSGTCVSSTAPGALICKSPNPVFTFRCCWLG
ncbi:MAG: hypothetical protein M1546_02510 [Chloroflexi bacterium]|nr:hypothetical protein [Chloroflexota bacterium]